MKPTERRRPSGAHSKLDLFEGFTKKIVDEVQANKNLWKALRSS